MQAALISGGFAEWRELARQRLVAGVPPDQVLWSSDPMLLDASTPVPFQSAADAQLPTFHVPARFVAAGEEVACHHDGEKWPLLYRVLWRLTHGEPRLLEIAVDPDVHKLLMMEKAVHRDVHKMKAFVRFRKVIDDAGEHFIAWHRPDHLIVPLAAPFFARRFAPMRWTILTPDQSVIWDTQTLRFGPGLPRSAAPAHDELEDAWRTYYGAIFNPARIKLKAMRKEMPVRYWSTLPETQMIDRLLATAPQRVETMLGHAASSGPASAEEFLPTERTLPQLAQAAGKCRGCPIHCHATQTVFGEGPENARLMFIGEQPGDQED
ncbi:MAG TPA: TIGR03915 family putative DNA repair protein, partial [Bradyrhizobium sp.]